MIATATRTSKVIKDGIKNHLPDFSSSCRIIPLNATLDFYMIIIVLIYKNLT